MAFPLLRACPLPRQRVPPLLTHQAYSVHVTILTLKVRMQIILVENNSEAFQTVVHNPAQRYNFWLYGKKNMND
jgi:hypothetical protein